MSAIEKKLEKKFFKTWKVNKEELNRIFSYTFMKIF